MCVVSMPIVIQPIPHHLIPYVHSWKSGINLSRQELRILLHHNLEIYKKRSIIVIIKIIFFDV